MTIRDHAIDIFAEAGMLARQVADEAAAAAVRRCQPDIIATLRGSA